MNQSPGENILGPKHENMLPIHENMLPIHPPPQEEEDAVIASLESVKSCDLFGSLSSPHDEEEQNVPLVSGAENEIADIPSRSKFFDIDSIVHIDSIELFGNSTECLTKGICENVIVPQGKPLSEKDDTKSQPENAIEAPYSPGNMSGSFSQLIGQSITCTGKSQTEHSVPNVERKNSNARKGMIYLKSSQATNSMKEITLKKVGSDEDKMGKTDVCQDQVEKTDVCQDKVEKTDASQDKVGKTDVYRDQVRKIDVCQDKVGKTDVCQDQVGKTDSSQDKVRKTDVCQDKVGKTDVCQDQVGKTDASQDQVRITDVCQDQVGKTDVCQDKVGKTDVCQDQLETINVCQDQVGKADVCQDQVGKTDLCQDQVGKTDVCQDKVEKTDASQDQVGKTDLYQNQVGKTDVCQDQVGKTDLYQNQVGKTDICQDQVGKTDVCQGHMSNSFPVNQDFDDTVETQKTQIKESQQFSHGGQLRAEEESKNIKEDRLPLEDEAEILFSVDSDGYARIKETDDVVYLTVLPNVEIPHLKTRPKTSVEFPLPPVPGDQIRPFCEADVDQRKKELPPTKTASQSALEKTKLKVEENDPVRLFLRNISPNTKEEAMVPYLEFCCKAIPLEIRFIIPGTILVTFSEPPDVEKLLVRVKEKPLEGQYIQVERVPITRHVQLSGLPPSATRDKIESYFNNTKHCGTGPVTDVRFRRDKQSCVVTFENVQDAERVCTRPHTIDMKDIQVCLYYECLDEDLQADKFSDVIQESGIFLSLELEEVRFIQRYKMEDIKALEKRFENSHIKLSITDCGEQKGIQINGTKDKCKEVKTELGKLAKIVMTKEYEMVDKVGLRKFLESSRGRDQLNSLELKFNCILMMEGISGNLQLEGKSGGNSSDSEDNTCRNDEPMDKGGASVDVQKMDVSVDQGKLVKQRTLSTALGGHPQSACSSHKGASSSSDKSEVHQTYKYSLLQSVVLEIVQGDITEENTDVIINSVLPNLDLTRGQVSKAILAAGGMSIQQECQDKIPDLKKDGFVVTNTGKLPCKKIIHILVQDKRKDLEDVIKRVLLHAEMLKYQSISFPGIGTGGRGLAPRMIAKAMYSACSEFAESKPKFLKKIRLVLFKEDVFNAIKEQVESKQRKGLKIGRKIFKRRSKYNSIVFSITADSESKFKLVIKDLEGLTKKKFI